MARGRFNSWYFTITGRMVLGYEHDRGVWGWDIRVLRGSWVVEFNRRAGSIAAKRVNRLRT